MENISLRDRVRDEEVLQRIKGERHIIQTVKRRKAKWNVHTLLRNCFLKHVNEGNGELRIEVIEDEEEDVSSCWMIP
jgi:hypothetical protein